MFFMLLSTEIMSLLAIIFIVLAIPLTGFMATLYSAVAVVCILVMLFNHLTDVDDEDF